MNVLSKMNGNTLSASTKTPRPKERETDTVVNSDLTIGTVEGRDIAKADEDLFPQFPQNSMEGVHALMEPVWSPRSPRDDLLFIGPLTQAKRRPSTPGLTDVGTSVSKYSQISKLNSWDVTTPASESCYDADVDTARTLQNTAGNGRTSAVAPGTVGPDVVLPLQFGELSLDNASQVCLPEQPTPRGELAEALKQTLGTDTENETIADSIISARTETESSTDSGSVAENTKPSATSYSWSSDSFDSVGTSVSDASFKTLPSFETETGSVGTACGQDSRINCVTDSGTDDEDDKSAVTSSLTAEKNQGTVSSPFKTGQHVVYHNAATSITEEMEIVAVHFDDYPSIYYTVRQLCAGADGVRHERQTDASRLLLINRTPSPVGTAAAATDASLDPADTVRNDKENISSLANIPDPNNFIDALCPPAATHISESDIKKLPCQFAFLPDHFQQLQQLQNQIHSMKTASVTEEEQQTPSRHRPHSIGFRRNGHHSQSSPRPQPAQSQRRPPKPQRKCSGHNFSVIVTIGGGANSVHHGRRFRLPNVNGHTTVSEIKNTIAKHLNLPLQFAPMLQFMYKKAVVNNGRVCLGELGVSEGGKIVIISSQY